MLEFEEQYLKQLPSAQMYEKSFMHRDTVTHVMVRVFYSLCCPSDCVAPFKQSMQHRCKTDTPACCCWLIVEGGNGTWCSH